MNKNLDVFRTLDKPWKFIHKNGLFIRPFYGETNIRSWWCTVKELEDGCIKKGVSLYTFSLSQGLMVAENYILNPFFDHLAHDYTHLHGSDFKKISSPDLLDIDFLKEIYDYQTLLSEGDRTVWIYKEGQKHLLILESRTEILGQFESAIN